MRRYYYLLPALLLIAAGYRSAAQCVTIINLPDTIYACKNTTVQLSPSVTSPGLLTTLDTTWTPAAGLSNPNIINPIATIGTTSVQYLLTIPALTANNFVNNGDFSAGNTGFTSSYIVPGMPYGTYGQLSNEGTYAVTTNPNLVHTNFASFSDHTGNAGGKMMVINGASSANTSIWCETVTVQPNTSYDFSAWGASTTATNPAVLQFSINGVLLGTPLSLPGVNGVWTQFHATYFSGANTSITICINDQQTALSGNDFAIDDIAFREICYAKDSVYIRVTNLTPSIQNVIKKGCTQDTVNFTSLNGTGDVPTTYQWTFGDGGVSILQNPQHIYTNQGQYTIKLVTQKNGCKDSASINIDTRHPLSVAFTTDKDTVCLGTPIQFTNTDLVTGPGTYYWSFGDGTTDNTANPSHTYTAPGIYHVVHVISDAIPCTDTARKTLVILPGPTASFTASDNLVCIGQTIRYEGLITPGYDTLMWTFGDGTVIMDQHSQNHAYDVAGAFTTTLTVGYPQCPTIILTKPVTVVAPPQINLGPDTSICPTSDPLLITAITTPGASLTWNDGSTGNSLLVTEPGTYWLRGTVAPGCTAADSVLVRNDCYLNMPNAFTPNGDGVNDYFFPRQLLSAGLVAFSMQIYDRWGEKIYETFNTTGRGWDGAFNDKPQPQGVYIYQVRAVLKDGTIQKYHGNVSLLR